MLELNGTLLVQLVNFVVFLAILNAIFMKPVGAAIARRRAYIDGLARDIESLQSDAKALRGQADEKRAVARRAADEVVVAARSRAGTEAEAIAGDAATRVQKLVSDAHAQVAQEVAAAEHAEPALVAGLAQTMVERAFASEAA